MVVLGIGIGALFAGIGTTDSPGPPDDPASASYTLDDLYNRLTTGADGSQTTFTEPSSGPGTGTMHTLNDIMAAAPAQDDTNGATPEDVFEGKTFWGLTSGEWGLRTGIGPNRRFVWSFMFVGSGRTETMSQECPGGLHPGIWACGPFTMDRPWGITVDIRPEPPGLGLRCDITNSSQEEGLFGLFVACS
jgi:hypothetical protein